MTRLSGQTISTASKNKPFLVEGLLSWLVRALSLVLIVLAIGGVVWSGEKLFQKLNIPVGVIAVKGQFSHVEQGEVQSLVEPLVEGGILSLNLEQIRHQLQQHPWIESAVVRREWPSGLSITVKEEVPIARWGKTGFLNSRGEMLAIADNQMLVDLPLLQGSEDSERSLMKAYREITQLLRPSSLAITQLRRDQRGAWWLQLSNGLELVVGRDGVMEKMRRFLVVWNSGLSHQLENIARLDIRYDNGVAVAWVNNIEQGQSVDIHKKT